MVETESPSSILMRYDKIGRCLWPQLLTLVVILHQRGNAISHTPSISVN